MSNNSTQFIHEQARIFAAKRLQRAAQYMEVHFKPSEKKTGRPNARELMRGEWPGVLSVFDDETGALLARSELGQPGVLAKDFKPTLQLGAEET